MSKKTTKFDVQAGLFKAEPPINPNDVKRLFYGREQELHRGTATLNSNLDVSGRVSKKRDKRPWVVHGESRSGKSHLARRIVAEFPSNNRRIQFLVTAKERLEAMIVMRQLFETLHGEFARRIDDQRLEVDLRRQPRVDLVRQLIDRIGLFAADVQGVELTIEKSSRESFELGAELSSAPLLAKFLAKYQSERTSKNGVKLNLRPPTPADLAAVCGIMVETLLAFKLINHCLVLVDDVDLLETYKSPSENARHERSILAMALDDLHGVPGVDVVLTARSWYVHASKELMPLVDLGASDMLDASVLHGIYNRRLEVYGNQLPAFLHSDALRAIAGDVNGLPGVFLQHLDTAFYQYQNENDDAQRDFAWLQRVFENRLEKLREHCSAGVDAILTAISADRLTIDVTNNNPFFGTVLDNEFVFQSYWNEKSYFISGFTRKIFERIFSKQART